MPDEDLKLIREVAVDGVVYFILKKINLVNKLLWLYIITEQRNGFNENLGSQLFAEEEKSLFAEGYKVHLTGPNNMPICSINNKRWGTFMCHGWLKKYSLKKQTQE